ncbi:unnamed protein product [Amoebophrya sp. A25]|nr:unnamed protein product [Amoebophrya sp. A25]|eukprot:GSA25T00016286001.1
MKMGKMVSAAEAKQREKKKQQKQNRKQRKAEQFQERLAKQQDVKSIKGKSIASVDTEAPENDEEYVIPELPFSQDDSRYDDYKKVFQTLSVLGDNEVPAAAKEVQKKKTKVELRKQVLTMTDAGEDDKPEKQKRTKKKFLVQELKSMVIRPDVVTEVDTTSPDPELLVYLKAYRNTAVVPPHWASKRRYLSTKKGQEKPRYKLPEFIEATGIAKIREAVLKREEQKGLKGMAKARLSAKMGKLDIDYQVLHDAFFKYQTKPKLTGHNDVYYEGKEQEMKMHTLKPGSKLTPVLMQALGMTDEKMPPPWLFNMQRYGPPRAYPTLRIPGINAPIPEGAEYGMGMGQWGRPPVDEFGNPKFGDWAKEQAARARRAQVDDTTLWGEPEDVSDEEEEMQAEGPEQDGQATPMVGHATPMVGQATPLVGGVGTPMIGGAQSSTGFRSTSGISSVTSGVTGLQTPGSMSGRYGFSGSSQGGIRSASVATPGPQLFQVLEEQKRVAGAGGIFPSSHGYNRGVATPGIATPGIATPGIATPGIATPGIATPGIATPGIATPGMLRPGVASAGGVQSVGVHSAMIAGRPGIQTPMGISTPMGIATPVGGIATPVGGIATPTGIASAGGIKSVEAEGMLTADIIRAQLKQHEATAVKARAAAHQKEVKKGKDKKKKKEFKF